jgi:hypothetical protein
LIGASADIFDELLPLGLPIGFAAVPSGGNVVSIARFDTRLNTTPLIREPQYRSFSRIPHTLNPIEVALGVAL